MFISNESGSKTYSLVGKRYAAADNTPLTPDDYRDLVKRRAVSILHITPDEQEWQGNEELRRETEQLIMEKIHRDSNLLPIDFLSKGVERAKAVCRIVTPAGLGTGFLIGRGLVMTNHHVLASVEEATGSQVEFGYEENGKIVKLALKPEEFFITSPFEELDFSIVACETAGIEDVIPVKLMRSPTTITRGEYVNIIQHPKGRQKEIALQDNTVSYVYEKVIHYTTDTEPGSSGAAVFNNQWQLVALHHAGWYTDNDQQQAVNEGIRISAIVAKLVALAQTGDSAALQLTQKLEGTSPYLGFYDVEGLVDNRRELAEIEIPSFKGDKRFADIGFWNIENFNNSVSEQRIKDVAHLVADMSMDTLGLVEVERGALDRLRQELKNRGAAMDYVYLDADGGQDLAVLYDTTTANVELRTDINLKYGRLLRSEINGKTAFPREPLFAKCTVREEGQNVEFLKIVVHLKAMRDAVSTERRTLAAQTLSVIIEDLKRTEEFKELPILLGGDLNDDAGSVSLSPVMNMPSVLTLTLDDAQAGHISYIGDHKSLIDHIIITKDTRAGVISFDGKQDDAGIVRFDKSMPDYASRISDHVPIVLRIIYKDSSTEQDNLRIPSVPSVVWAQGNTMEHALLKLQLNRFRLEEERGYYDAEKDKFDIVNYYRSVDLQSGGGQVFRQLHQLMLETHNSIFSYPASRTQLYAGVDIREDGSLHSLYSGEKLDAEELIREDHRTERLRKEFMESLALHGQEEEEGFQELIDEKFGFNVEHVVPQSWFSKSSPMRGDLHHLFICEKECNSYRSNIPYYDFADYNPEAYRETVRNACGKRGGMIRFEPESGKGEAARAVLYFLVRYPGKIERQNERIDIKLLLGWHKEHPVSLHEKHRNQLIFELQGNRNPFIDLPEIADQIEF
ncbi:endonuclease [Paenibacillus sp. FSL P2-0089]|uniref:endonuclease n=1 Tax=Paenibacillus sp. FSL P2-0089 TaxID=2954526 RepID=UPI003159C30F